MIRKTHTHAMENNKGNHIRSNASSVQSPRIRVEDKPFSQWTEENTKLYPSYAPPVQVPHYGSEDMYPNYSYPEHPSPYYVMYPSGQKVLMAPVLQRRASYSRKPLMERRPSPLQSPANKSNSFGGPGSNEPLMNAHPKSAPVSFNSNHQASFNSTKSTFMYADTLKPLTPSLISAPRAYTGKKKRNNGKSAPPRRKRKKMYSDYVGVTFNKTHNKFQACITHFRKQHYLGRYKLSTDAAKAYDDSARNLKGPGWKINFPTEREFIEARKIEEEAFKMREPSQLGSGKVSKPSISKNSANVPPRSITRKKSAQSGSMDNNENVENTSPASVVDTSTSSIEEPNSFITNPMEVIASPGRACAMEAATTLMTLIGAPL